MFIFHYISYYCFYVFLSVTSNLLIRGNFFFILCFQTYLCFSTFCRYCGHSVVILFPLLIFNSNHMRNTVLFVHPKSNYYQFPCMCYSEKDNALNFYKSIPAIYHPPCRSWSRLRGLATRIPVDHWLALWSLIRVRRYGGILEHPAGSLLFNKYIIKPGAGVDQWGGFSLCVDLHWFGFPAVKRTYLYFVGCSVAQLPVCPISFDAVTHVVGTTNKKSDLKELSKKQRSLTPVSMCEWLLKCLEVIKSNELN